MLLKTTCKNIVTVDGWRRTENKLWWS